MIKHWFLKSSKYLNLYSKNNNFSSRRRITSSRRTNTENRSIRQRPPSPRVGCKFPKSFRLVDFQNAQMFYFCLETYSRVIFIAGFFRRTSVALLYSNDFIIMLFSVLTQYLVFNYYSCFIFSRTYFRPFYFRHFKQRFRTFSRLLIFVFSSRIHSKTWGSESEVCVCVRCVSSSVVSQFTS